MVRGIIQIQTNSLCPEGFTPKQVKQRKPIKVRTPRRNEVICQSLPNRARSQRLALLIPNYGALLGEIKRLTACGSNFPSKKKKKVFALPQFR